MQTAIPCPKCAKENLPTRPDALFPINFACACGERYTSATLNLRDGVQSVVRNLVKTGRLLDNPYMVGAADLALRRAIGGESDNQTAWLVGRLTEPERGRLGLAVAA